MIQGLEPKQKTLLLGTGLGLGVLIVSFGFMQVPLGVGLQALFPAIAGALTATALVLIYRTVRVINFAQIAMGSISAQLFYELYTREILPFPIALVVGLAAGALVGLLIGMIAATLFFRHPRLVMTVVTIFMTGVIGYISGEIQGAFVKPGEVRPIFPIPLPGQSFWNTEVFSLSQLPFRVAHILSLVLLGGLAVGLVLFFRKTRVGTAVRASAENSDRASLLGINVKALQIGVWTLVGVIGSVSAVAILPVQQYNPSAGTDQTDFLLPLAAAVLARFQSMPLAFSSALGLVMLQRSITFSYASLTPFIDVGLVGILMIGLLLQRKRIQVRADDSTSWRATKEVRPTPREMLALKAISRTRRVLVVIAAAVVLAVPWITGIETTAALQGVWTTAIVGISLVILTGWTGQISLGQMAIVAVGAFVGGNMTLRMGIPFWFALPLSGLVGALFAVLIGIPALRIRGLFLAASTFGVAIIAPLFIFDPRFLGKWVPEQDMKPPKLFFLDFADQRSMYYLSLLFFVAVVAGVLALRRSRGGRVLIALRDNESGVQSFGIDIVRTRLTAFAISGFIAAFAGALIVHQSLGMDPRGFTAGASINIFIMVVIGGVSSIAGAFLGALFFVGGALLFPTLLNIISGVAGLIVLMAIPGGLTQIVFGTRDAILRVVAMRQHIIVPSLFADYSPDAWEKRLAPLAPALQSQGLATLKPDQRYALPSKVFEGASA